MTLQKTNTKNIIWATLYIQVPKELSIIPIQTLCGTWKRRNKMLRKPNWNEFVKKKNKWWNGCRWGIHRKNKCNNEYILSNQEREFLMLILLMGRFGLVWIRSKSKQLSHNKLNSTKMNWKSLQRGTFSIKQTQTNNQWKWLSLTWGVILLFSLHLGKRGQTEKDYYDTAARVTGLGFGDERCV